MLMLSKSELLRKYEILKDEMKKRGLKIKGNTPLDDALGVVLFKRAMMGIDVTHLEDVVVIPDYITIGGEFVKSPRDVEDINVVMRQDEGDRDEELEGQISKVVESQTKKKCIFIYKKAGPSSTCIPLFDLVLRAKDSTRRVEVKEDYAKETEKAKIVWVIPKVYIPIMGGYAHEHSKNEFSRNIVKWRADVTNKEYLEEFGTLLYKAIKDKLGTAWEVLTYPGEVDSGRPVHQLVKWLAKKMKVIYRSIQTQNPTDFGNKRVLVIDDIVASGATARKAVKRVRDGNAKVIGFAALGRSKPKMKERFWLEKADKEGAEESLPALKDYEDLLHHIHVDSDGKDEIHHCLILDHIANMFEQTHLWIKDGKVYLDGKQVKEGVFHVVKGLEPTQEVVWGDKEAEENKITAKKIKRGMTLKEKAKEW